MLCKVAISSYNLTMCESSNLPASLPTLVIRCEVESHCGLICIFLKINNAGNLMCITNVIY